MDQGQPQPEEQLVTELLRRGRTQQLNAAPGSREYWEAKYGKVWDTGELSGDFEVLGFMAPYCVVRRRSDGKKGSVEFAHDPRWYFNFVVYEG